MPLDHFLSFRPCACFFDTTNIQGPILSREGTHTTHIISVVGELVASEAVLRCVGESGERVRECVEVFALPSVRTASAREEQAAVLHSRRVRTSQACVLLDVASRLGLDFAAQSASGISTMQ